MKNYSNIFKFEKDQFKNSSKLESKEILILQLIMEIFEFQFNGLNNTFHNHFGFIEIAAKSRDNLQINSFVFTSKNSYTSIVNEINEYVLCTIANYFLSISLICLSCSNF